MAGAPAGRGKNTGVLPLVGGSKVTQVTTAPGEDLCCRRVLAKHLGFTRRWARKKCELRAREYRQRVFSSRRCLSPVSSGRCPAPRWPQLGFCGVTRPQRCGDSRQCPLADAVTVGQCQAPHAQGKGGLGTGAPALGPAGALGKQNQPGGQQGCRSHFREPLRYNFVFGGREKRAKSVCHSSAPCAEHSGLQPSPALPLPSSHTAEKLHHRVQAADTTKTWDFHASAPSAAEITPASQGPPALQLYFQ